MEIIADKLYDCWQRLKAKDSKLFFLVKRSKMLFPLMVRIYICIKTKQDIDYLNQVKNILSDKESKDILETIIITRKKWLFQQKYPKHIGEQYFSLDEFGIKMNNKEVFIDGGAYIGDTLERFIQVVNNEYKYIYCFEPDVDNYEKLRKCVNENKYKNVSLFCNGLWSSSLTLNFRKSNSSGSGISKTGDSIIEAVCLDEIIPFDEVVTYIKMDIEGAELEALKGSKRIIDKDNPKLAICLYHKPNDLYEIPLYIHANYPNYKLYIRHHSTNNCETVLYAI